MMKGIWKLKQPEQTPRNKNKLGIFLFSKSQKENGLTEILWESESGSKEPREATSNPAKEMMSQYSEK